MVDYACLVDNLAAKAKYGICQSFSRDILPAPSWYSDRRVEKEKVRMTTWIVLPSSATINRTCSVI